MFLLINLVFPIMFLLVIGALAVNIFEAVSTWNENNNSPRLTVYAKVVSKRTNTTHHNHGNGGDISGMHGYTTTSDTTYYVTFQVNSGDRMEFNIAGKEYGMLAYGDVGNLSFQGSRYLSFACETL